jgi:hypothetical protein
MRPPAAVSPPAAGVPPIAGTFVEPELPPLPVNGGAVPAGELQPTISQITPSQRHEIVPSLVNSSKPASEERPCSRAVPAGFDLALFLCLINESLGIRGKLHALFAGRELDIRGTRRGKRAGKRRVFWFA